MVKKPSEQQVAAEAERKKRAEGLASRERISEQEHNPNFLPNLERLRTERRERDKNKTTSLRDMEND
jgi:hypothetical protein